MAGRERERVKEGSEGGVTSGTGVGSVEEGGRKRWPEKKGRGKVGEEGVGRGRGGGSGGEGKSEGKIHERGR